MYIAVCDDEQVHLRRTVERVRAIPALTGATVEAYASPERLLNAAVAREIDIAILDVRMEQSGIDVARRIRALNPRCQVIFLSGCLECATEVYDVDHVYFVLKSEFEQRFDRAVGRALEKLRRLEGRKISIAFNGQTTILRAGDIKYLERTGHRTRVVTGAGEHFTYERPESLLKACGAGFVRCHSSFFVNPDWVISISKNQIELSGGGVVPVSRLYAAPARRALLNGAAAAEP